MCNRNENKISITCVHIVAISVSHLSFTFLHLVERSSSAPHDTCSSAQNGNQRTPREVPIKEEIFQATAAGHQRNQSGNFSTFHLRLVVEKLWISMGFESGMIRTCMFSLIEMLTLVLKFLYPRHLCRRVYSFRLSVCPFVCSFVLPSRSWNLRQSFALKFLKWCISATTYQKAFIFGP